MGCIYKYGNLTFNSELELDDFILSKGYELVEEIGDIAYQKQSSRQIALRKALKELKTINSTLSALLKNKQQEDSFNYMFEGRHKVVDAEYTAITDFLLGLRNLDDKLLFPEMIKDNFFAERDPHWRNKDFTKRELYDLKDALDLREDAEGNIIPPDNVDTLLIGKIRSIFEEKWDTEAKIGTAIHKCCETFFSLLKNGDPFYDENDKLLIKGRKLTNEQLKEHFKRFGNFDSYNVSLFLSDAQMNQIIQYCNKLLERIERSTWKSKSGGSFMYYPELKIRTKAINPITKEDTYLVGTIDLLVIDPRGIPHIIDYKVSPADYLKQSKINERITEPDLYSSAKILGFEYQLATYARMLRAIDGRFRDTTVAVAPIQLLGLNYDKSKRVGKRWNFEKIRLDSSVLETLLDEEPIRRKKVENNLNQIFEEIPVIDADAGNILTTVQTVMDSLFKDFSGNGRGYSKSKLYFDEETTAELIKDSIQKSSDEKTFECVFDDLIFKAKTEPLLVQAVMNYLNRESKEVTNTVNKFILQIDTEEVYTSTRTENDLGKIEWYKDLVLKYANTDVYRVLDSDLVPEALKQLGIVIIENFLTGNYDIIKLSNHKLKPIYHLGKNKKLTGKFMDDIEDESGKNYILDARLGNFEIIETLLALNLIPSIFSKGRVNRIHVVNPYLNSGLTATNKQILYTYNKLMEFSPIPESLGRDYIKEGVILFNSLIHLAFDVLLTGYERSSPKIKDLFNSCLPDFTKVFSMKDEKLKESLKEVLELMESGEESQNALKQIKKYADINDLRINIDPRNILYWYQAVLLGYTEAMGYDFKLQCEEYSKYFDSYNPEKGHSGLRLDNPGTTANQNANMVSEFIENCFNRLATRLKAPTAKIQNLVRKLKEERGRTWLQDKLTFSPLSIYTGMTKTVKRVNRLTGEEWEDWLFENPKNLSGALKELAEYVLLMINYNRHGKGEGLEKFQKRMNDDLALDKNLAKWLRVPLGYVGTTGVLETNGLMKGILDYLRSWKWSEIKRRTKDLFGHLYDDKGLENRQEIYRMRLIFDRGEDVETRLEMLKDPKTGENRIKFYDHDIERLLLKHLYAYYLKDEFDEASYMIKAATIDLKMTEAYLNADRTNSVNYLTDLVKRMSGKTLMTEQQTRVNMYVKKFMQGASVMALGFSPKQIYLALEGIYKDIGLLIRKPDGTYGFTFSDMLAAFANTWKEIGHFGMKRSKLERMNELFRLNDMDMNVYALHLQDRHNIWHDLSTFLFRFASRPDFYNRLTIIQSYMRHDGVWDAYELDENNELLYRFEKDGRFQNLLHGNKNTKEYLEELGLYLAMADLFEREGAYNSDGTKFRNDIKNNIINPLPQAYTNKEMNSMKALTDLMYGYYSYEKKALILSSLVGAMFFQMYTYFSGKKNQWLAPGSVKNLGRMLQYEEFIPKEVRNEATGEITMDRESKKYYWQTDELGTILFDLPPVTEEELRSNVKVPFITWKGQFSQGILTTMARMLGDVVRSDFSEQTLGKAVKLVYADYWDNPDENLRTAYRLNLKQFSYEMFIFLMVGGIIGSQIHRAINEYTNDHKDDKSVALGFRNASGALFDAIFKTSTLDFNVFDSLGGRGLSWTPFSIDMWKRTVQNWSKAVTGDRTILDATLRTFSASKYTLVPLLNTVRDTSNASNE